MVTKSEKSYSKRLDQSLIDSVDDEYIHSQLDLATESQQRRAEDQR